MSKQTPKNQATLNVDGCKMPIKMQKDIIQACDIWPLGPKMAIHNAFFMAFAMAFASC